MSLQILPPKGGTNPNPFATTGQNSVRMPVPKVGFYDWEWVSDLERIDDTEELARLLVESTECSHDHPRLEALFRRAASGNGHYAQILRTSGMI